MDDVALESLRIDKWLWAARFFKTRSLAAQAVSGGLVQVADQRVKPSRRLRRGDLVHIRRGAQAWDVVVAGLRGERRPAPEAQSLFEETPESIERRTSERARREQAAMRRGKGAGAANQARPPRSRAVARGPAGSPLRATGQWSGTVPLLIGRKRPGSAPETVGRTGTDIARAVSVAPYR